MLLRTAGSDPGPKSLPTSPESAVGSFISHLLGVAFGEMKVGFPESEEGNESCSLAAFLPSLPPFHTGVPLSLVASGDPLGHLKAGPGATTSLCQSDLGLRKKEDNRAKVGETHPHSWKELQAGPCDSLEGKNHLPELLPQKGHLYSQMLTP